MPNETVGTEKNLPVNKSACLCDQVSQLPVQHNSEPITGEDFPKDTSKNKSNSKRDDPKTNATTVTQCHSTSQETTSPVSLKTMKQKLFSAMHTKSGCQRCKHDSESDEETVNSCLNCANESLEVTPQPSAPLLKYVVDKLLAENVKTESCYSRKETEHNDKTTVVRTPTRENKENEPSNAAVDERCSTDDVTTVISNHESEETKSNDISSKIDALLLNMDDSEEESETNPYIDAMAEEGEEDTPSEGSNDIIEVGEEINTTESELSSDESYENNSFIDDDEDHPLLSGEEYDLSHEEPKRRRRIIQLSSGSDDGIVRLPKKEKVVKRRKKSRIIRFEDSSDEDTPVVTDGLNTVSDNNEDIKLENCEKNDNEDQKLVSQNENGRNETCDLDEDNNKIGSAKGDLNVAATVEDEQSMNEECQIVDLEEHTNESEKNDSVEGETEKFETGPVLEICEKEEVPETSDDKKKIIILENIKISDIDITDLSRHVNNVMNPKVNNIHVNDDEKSANVNNAVETPVTPKNCEKTRPVTVNRKKKRKRKDKRNKMRQASNGWTDERFANKTLKSSPFDPFKNYFKCEVTNQDCFAGGNKKIKKRKRLDSNSSLCSEEHFRKKRKRNKAGNKKKEIQDTHTNILEDAVLHDETQICWLDTCGDNEDWRVAKRTLKPSEISEKHSGSKVYKNSHSVIKVGPKRSKLYKKDSKKSQDVTSKVLSKRSKVYEKDFKNLMLSDNRNIRRIETKELLRKRD